MAILQALIILPIAVLIGTQFVPNPAYFILAFIVIFFAFGSFSAKSILVASFMKTRERFMGISNALSPIQIMPSILREFPTFNSLSYVLNAVRGLLITGDLSNVLIDFCNRHFR